MTTDRRTALYRQAMASRIWTQLRTPWVVDAAIMVAVGVPTIMDAWWNAPGSRQADGWTYLFTVASIVGLVFRRRWPIAASLWCGAALSGLYILGHHGELLNLPVMVALYTVAAQGNRRTTVIVGIIGVTWSGILGFTSDDPIGARGGSPVLEMIIPLIPLALGEATRVRRQLVAMAEAEREHEAQRRVDDERARMARDLHDILAHTMAAVNVQMAAAVAAFDRDPEVARASLVGARASSRKALDEIRATVQVLRHDADMAPAPTIDDIPAMVDTIRTAGPDIRYVDQRNGVEVSGAIELVVYRVVQEALTNVLRHSGAREAVVTIGTAERHLVANVSDDGPTDGEITEGFGLRGMAERARSVGGTVDHGTQPGGGFAVTLRIPLETP